MAKIVRSVVLALSLVVLGGCSGTASPTAPNASPAVSPSKTSAPPASANAAPASASAGVATSAPASAAAQASVPAASQQPSHEPAHVPPPIDQLSKAATQKVGPAVVKITHTVAGGRGTSLGSGTIIDSKGYILTNAHVAAGATSYNVTLADNRTVSGKLTGLDPLDDLAVIQVDVPNLPVADLGDSSKLEVAQTVLAIGNPIGFTRTVTQGIVSALDRTITQPPDPATGQGGIGIPNMIQISAPINPGNSGGALIDLEGRLVGVPTLAATVPELGGAAQGIGFAVPVNTAKFIVPQLISQGKVTNSGRAYLGVATQTVDPSLASAYGLPASSGAFVAQVAPGSPAAQAGLKQGDIITSFDGQQVQTSQELGELILHKKPGDQAQLVYVSGGKQQTATVTLREAPVNQS